MTVISPLTNSNQVILEREVATDYLIKEYKNAYDIDVNHYFNGIKNINIYRCIETGFRFYNPSNIDGNSEFYEKLQKFPWYYMDWKWEHQAIYSRIKTGDQVLEIGCAKGSFIQQVAKKGAQGFGLELNEEAVKFSQKQGLNVLCETIQDHAAHHPEKYDVVCSFQVMEHIADVKSVLEASIKVLKKGGTLIISVPNNNSFIKKSPNSILNMPPHHMCLWDEVSLTNIENLFDIKKEDLLIEPLQKYHYPVIWSNMLYDKIPSKLVAKIVNKVSYSLGFHRLVGLRKNKIVGHSIIGIYSKNKM